jgi:hypothetical protein
MCTPRGMGGRDNSIRRSVFSGTALFDSSPHSTDQSHNSATRLGDLSVENRHSEQHSTPFLDRAIVNEDGRPRTTPEADPRHFLVHSIPVLHSIARHLEDKADEDHRHSFHTRSPFYSYSIPRSKINTLHKIETFTS